MTSIVFWVNVYLNLYITIIGSDNGLLPGWCQAIIWTNAGILLIGPPGTNFSEIFINIHTFSFKKIHLKMASGKWRPFCLNVIIPLQIRKSKDYVYGIWVYKALDIWKGYYRVKKSLVSYVKPWTEARNNKYMKYHSKLTYQLSFWNVSRKVDYHAGGKWFIHGPKRRKENQLLSLKHSCWLSLV